MQDVKDNGVVLSADRRQAVYKIHENASTGYAWNFDKKECSEDLVQIESEYKMAEQPEGLEPLDGVPGTRYLTFMATGDKKGTCEFRMAYARPWEFNWTDQIYNNMLMIEFDIIVE